jgi:chemotaxis response regulator CheB
MKSNSFPIVALGASAGGIKALNEFFSYMSSESNLAFIVITHLKRDSESVLDKILARTTTMPVSWATNNQVVEPNHIYVLPVSKYMTTKNGRLQLVDRHPLNRINNAIDIFFESLAKARDAKSIGIIFSGGGSDGTQGAICIHNKGGLVMAQDLATAEIDSMPSWAIMKDHVQFVLSPKELARTLLKLTTNQENK